MKKWFLGSGSKTNLPQCSQSENCLALSDDFSEKDEIMIGSESKSFTKTVLSSSDDSVSNEVQSQRRSQTICAYPQLSWARRYILLPSFTFIFMAVLPFIQGCLYTVGYRIGKRVLKIVLKPKTD